VATAKLQIESRSQGEAKKFKPVVLREAVQLVRKYCKIMYNEHSYIRHCTVPKSVVRGNSPHCDITGQTDSNSVCTEALLINK